MKVDFQILNIGEIRLKYKCLNKLKYGWNKYVEICWKTKAMYEKLKQMKNFQICWNIFVEICKILNCDDFIALKYFSWNMLKYVQNAEVG